MLLILMDLFLNILDRFFVKEKGLLDGQHFLVILRIFLLQIMRLLTLSLKTMI